MEEKRDIFVHSLDISLFSLIKLKPPLDKSHDEKRRQEGFNLPSPPGVQFSILFTSVDGSAILMVLPSKKERLALHTVLVTCVDRQHWNDKHHVSSFLPPHYQALHLPFRDHATRLGVHVC